MLAVLFVKTCCGPYKKNTIYSRQIHMKPCLSILKSSCNDFSYAWHTKDTQKTTAYIFFFQNLCIKIVFTSIWTKLAFQHSVSLMSRFILHNSNVFFKNMFLYNFCNTKIHFDLVIKIFLLYKSKTYSKYPTYVLITLKKIHIIFSFWN